MPISPRSNIDPDAILSLTGDDLDADWSLFVNKVTVSYQQYDTLTDANTTTTTGIEALYQEQEKKEVDTGDGNFVHRRTRMWNLRAYMMPGVTVVKRGRIIEADGTIWVVVSTMLRSFSTRWRCECYALNG